MCEYCVLTEDIEVALFGLSLRRQRHQAATQLQHTLATGRAPRPTIQARPLTATLNPMARPMEAHLRSSHGEAQVGHPPTVGHHRRMAVAMAAPHSTVAHRRMAGPHHTEDHPPTVVKTDQAMAVRHLAAMPRRKVCTTKHC